MVSREIILAKKISKLRNVLERISRVSSNSDGSRYLVAPRKDRITIDDHKESRRPPPFADRRFVGWHSHIHNLSAAHLGRFCFSSCLSQRRTVARAALYQYP